VSALDCYTGNTLIVIAYAQVLSWVSKVISLYDSISDQESKKWDLSVYIEHS